METELLKEKIKNAVVKSNLMFGFSAIYLISSFFLPLGGFGVFALFITAFFTGVFFDDRMRLETELDLLKLDEAS